MEYSRRGPKRSKSEMVIVIRNDRFDSVPASPLISGKARSVRSNTFRWASDSNHTTVVEHHDCGSETGNFGQRMGHVDDGHLRLVTQPLDERQYFRFPQLVERREWLIHQKETRRG